MTNLNDPRAKSVPVAWLGPIRQWAQWLRAADRSPATIATRTDHIRRLARAVGGDPWQLTAARLVEWVGGQAWSRETRRSTHASIRTFFDWGVAKGHLTVSPAGDLPRVRASEPMPRPTPDRVQADAMAHADERTRLILRCAGEAGLRRAEVAVIHRDDLVEDLGGWSLLVHGKGGRQRLVPLSESLALAVRAACLAGGGFAFPGAQGGHLSPRWVGKLATDALPGAWTLHSLRHRFATRAHAGTHDLIAVQHLLGHQSVATTQRYVATGTDALRRAAQAAA